MKKTKRIRKSVPVNNRAAARQALKNRMGNNKIATAWHNATYRHLEKHQPEALEEYAMATRSGGGKRQRLLDKVNRRRLSARWAK